MPHFLKGLITTVLLISLFNACSTTETSVMKGPGVESPYPVWYNTTGFESDSVAYYGFGEAISDDSTIAAANAELQARANFESRIAELMEDVRLDLADQGVSEVNETDFIITLRNAHQQVQDAANRVNAEAASEESYYRGFVEVRLTKEELESLLRSGFDGKNTYWNTFSSASFFEE